MAAILESAENALPVWTFEDFTESSKPYDWLYDNYFGKSFLFRQYSERVARAAANVGFRGFKALLRDYLRDRGVRTRDSDVPENYTDFPGQEKPLRCGAYICDAQGVRLPGSGGFETIVCSHPITVSGRLVNIDTDITALVISFFRRGKWKNITAPKTLLASANKIVELAAYGIDASSENARDLVRFIAELENLNDGSIEEKRSVGRLGWNSDCTQFIPYSAHLDFDGAPSYRATYEGVRCEGSLTAWTEAVGSARLANPVVRIVLAASLASVLVKPLGNLPFLVHVWGRTSNGKTLLLKAAASMWASPDDGVGFIRSFNSTVVGLETSAGFMGSLPLCIDELQIAKRRGDFDDLIYMLTEGQGRSRGSKDGGFQQLKSWRNCIITTGEMPIVGASSGGGASARVIEIDCKSDDLFEDFGRMGDVLSRNYGFFGRAFVELLLSNPSNLELVREIREECKAELGRIKTVSKQVASAALIMAADRLADMLLWHSATTLEADTVARYMTRGDEVDVNLRALEWLYDTVAQFSMNFYTDVNHFPREIWGKIDETHVYIIRSVFDKITSEAGFSPKAFLSWAVDRGHVEYQGGKYTVVARLDGKLARCVKLVKREAEAPELPPIDGSDLPN